MIVFHTSLSSQFEPPIVGQSQEIHQLHFSLLGDTTHLRVSDYRGLERDMLQVCHRRLHKVFRVGNTVLHIPNVHSFVSGTIACGTCNEFKPASRPLTGSEPCQHF